MPHLLIAQQSLYFENSYTKSFSKSVLEQLSFEDTIFYILTLSLKHQVSRFRYDILKFSFENLRAM
jgi:hypothetical protein